MKNGDVLVRACGESEKINAMEQWLHVGSPYSRVEKVEAVPLDDQPDYSDFSIKTEGLW
jgi:acylphosphatase